jgi:hypothetical protein
MAKLLMAVRDTLTDARDRMVGGAPAYPYLRDEVPTFRIGPLTINAVYPALVVLPETIVITSRFSGNLVNISRSLSIHTFVKAHSIEMARDLMQSIAREAREACQTGLAMKDFRGTERTFRLDMGEYAIVGSTGIKDSLLWQGQQDLSFTSREQLPTGRSQTGTSRQVTPKELMDALEGVFDGNSAQNETIAAFSEIQMWQKVPIGRFPALVVSEVGEVTDERWTGRDQMTRQFEAHIYTQWAVESEAVLDLVDLAEGIRDFVYEHNRLEGRAIDMNMGTITFGNEPQDESWLFKAVVPFSYRCWEPVVYS